MQRYQGLSLQDWIKLNYPDLDDGQVKEFFDRIPCTFDYDKGEKVWEIYADKEWCDKLSQYVRTKPLSKEWHTLRKELGLKSQLQTPGWGDVRSSSELSDLYS